MDNFFGLLVVLLSTVPLMALARRLESKLESKRRADSPSDVEPPASVPSAVFESFYHTSTPEGPHIGAGIALAVTRNLVRNLSAFESPVPLRALLVDEDATTRRVLGTALSKAGYQIREAASGVEATRLLHGQPSPDLILLDENRPTSEGAELIAALRKVAPHTPILRVSPTAQASAEPTTAGPEANLVAYAVYQLLLEALRQMTATPVGASSDKPK